MRPVVPLPRNGRFLRSLKSVLGLAVLPAVGLAARAGRRRRGPLGAQGDFWPFEKSPKTILLVRFDVMGDTVMSLYLAADLKSIHPEAEITFATTPASAPVVKLCPHVDHVLQADMPAVTHARSALRLGAWTASLAMLGSIRSSSFDLAISVYGPLAGAVVGISGAKWRIGYQSESPSGCFDLPLPGNRAPGTRHEIQWIRGLAGWGEKALAKDVIVLPERARRRAEELVPQDDGMPVVAIHPGAKTGDAKQWPPDSWRSLVELLQSEGRARVVVVGDAGERDRGNYILGPGGEEGNLAGKTSIAELAATISRCHVLVSGDSGPLHLAAAINKPVVGLYGPTDPVLSGPFGENGRYVAAGIPCSPCYDLRAPAICPFGDQLCMEWITPQQVLREVVTQLERHPSQ